MAASPDTVSMAMFCDFENVALGVRDANYEKFDIKPVLERLLLKGSIVVKKAYCDWDRYKGFKATMHEANFELIEIPHVRQSGKNSADIRMVVDALDLCYTKAHVNTFVIVSGDSDFSPLVSKLRENAKYVIGVGVKQSTSDLLIANCDEFIFYDDLVRESQRSAARRDPKAPQSIAKRSPEEIEARKSEAVELAVATVEALLVERGDTSKIWASMLKEAIKRRKPDFNESNFGFRSFTYLLEEAQTRGLLELGRDEKSGTFVFRSSAPLARTEVPVAQAAPATPANEGNDSAKPAVAPAGSAEPAAEKTGSRRRGRGEKRRPSGEPDQVQPVGAEPATPAESSSETAGEPAVVAEKPVLDAVKPQAQPPRQRGRSGSRRHADPTPPPVVAVRADEPSPGSIAESVVAPVGAASVQEPTSPAPEAAVKKSAPRNRRPRKPKATVENGGA